jgi:hypothetical protein
VLQLHAGSERLYSASMGSWVIYGLGVRTGSARLSHAETGAVPWRRKNWNGFLRPPIRGPQLDTTGSGVDDA